MESIVDHPDGVTVRLHVVAGASSSEVNGRYGDTIKIRVAAPPEGGRANRAVVDLLERIVGGTAEIVRGHRSPAKTILIRGVDPATAREVLGG